MYKEVTETTAGRRDRGMWLRRCGLSGLVQAMEALSLKYGMDWAGRWILNLDKPAWLRKALAHTFRSLSAADRQKVAEDYELWLWYDRNCDMDHMVRCEYYARCYILDGWGRRIRWQGRYQTICVAVRGETRQKAILQLDTDANEFIEWM